MGKSWRVLTSLVHLIWNAHDDNLATTNLFVFVQHWLHWYHQNANLEQRSLSCWIVLHVQILWGTSHQGYWVSDWGFQQLCPQHGCPQNHSGHQGWAWMCKSLGGGHLVPKDSFPYGFSSNQMPFVLSSDQMKLYITFVYFIMLGGIHGFILQLFGNFQLHHKSSSKRIGSKEAWAENYSRMLLIWFGLKAFFQPEGKAICPFCNYFPESCWWGWYHGIFMCA